MKTLTKFKNIAFFLVLFTLPMYTNINNIVLVVFFGFFVLEGKFKSKLQNLKRYYYLAIPLSLLFVLAFIASVNNPDHSIFKYLEKYWGLLIIPIVIIGSSDYDGNEGKKVFLPLLLGCIATLLICYGNVIYEIIAWDEPLHYFLRHRHLNHEFTEIADTHPAYLGVFMACSTAYLLFESSIKKQLKVVIIIFFTFAMIQLASRMAFVSFGLIVFVFALLRLKKYWRQILIGLGAALICGTLLFVSASEFLRDRLVNTENFENDKRFSRNIVSWEIFKEHPLIGVGFGRKDVLRKTKYEAYGFKTASENKYNAHNQYLEYLSVNGLLGGIAFIAILIYLLYVSWKRRSILFFVIFSVFFIANLTESMLVRIKGIEFFAITVSLLATITMKLKENERINNP